jgi:hypothetical protein
VHAGRKQPFPTPTSSLDSCTEMRVPEYPRIHSHCCYSHQHATIKLPDGCPFTGGDQSAPCQVGALGLTQVNFLEKTMLGLL